jgi:catechol 2,3-dioxygenase-like lactoylglutathione lyase family enzyme
LRFHHIGIPTDERREGEVYLEHLGFHCTDHRDNDFGIQWMRFDADCALPALVQELPHVAFEVDDLDGALEGMEVIVEPNSPSPGVRVAFVACRGAPVELLELSG